MKTIPLTQGFHAIVDDEDYEALMKFKWHVRLPFNRGKAKYAVGCTRKNGKCNNFSMHRIIMKAKEDQQVDHINSDGLDNRKSNLRFCSGSQNSQRIPPKGKSKYKGVYLSRYDNVKLEHWAWRAVTRKDKKIMHIGRFGSEIEAAKAYDKVAREIFGEHAYLNFPNNHE